MANSLFQKHIISIPEFTRDELELVVETAGKLKAEPNPELLKNKVVASCFLNHLLVLAYPLRRQYNV